MVHIGLLAPCSGPIIVGLVQQEAEIPRGTEIINIKHYKFPQEDAEIQATANDLVQAGVFCYIHSPLIVHSGL